MLESTKELTVESAENAEKKVRIRRKDWFLLEFTPHRDAGMRGANDKKVAGTTISKNLCVFCELGGEKKYAIRKMAGKIVINTERCKGCGLCVVVCPKDCIVISKRSNKTGYFPAEASNLECTGCAMCAIICPEAIIEVYRDEANTIEIVTKPGSKGQQRHSCEIEDPLTRSRSLKE